MQKLATYFLSFCLFTSVSFSQNQKLSEKATVSIISCGSGAELYSIYGHTAIRITDAKNYIDLVYNYGMFDFSTENFYLKFVKGDMQYFMGVNTYAEFIYEYQYTNRAVFAQELYLTTQQKQQLFDTLNKTLFSDKRFYTYKFIDRNCTTMVLDHINAIYGVPVVTKKITTQESYRTILYGYLNNHFWENLGINSIFGMKVDQTATKIFLPNELMISLKTAKHNNKPIGGAIKILHQKTNTAGDFSMGNSIYLYCLILIVLLVLNSKILYLTYLSILGMLGVFFCGVGLYSFHQEIWWNYNALLFNPLLLLLVYFVATNNTKLCLAIIYINLGALVVQLLFIVNKVNLIMFLPLIMSSVIILFKLKKYVLLASVK
jgi:hypothetical protein